MWMMSLLIIACGQAPEPNVSHELAPPPSTPNCVHSQADPSDAQHFIEPIRFTEDPEAIWTRLHEVVMAQKRVELVDEAESYRHYVFTTAFLRFKDDVEFVIDRDGKVLHFRSASRVGHSDLGVNRKRMERIREALAAK